MRRPRGNLALARAVARLGAFGARGALLDADPLGAVRAPDHDLVFAHIRAGSLEHVHQTLWIVAHALIEQSVHEVSRAGHRNQGLWAVT